MREAETQGEENKDVAALRRREACGPAANFPP